MTVVQLLEAPQLAPASFSPPTSPLTRRIMEGLKAALVHSSRLKIARYLKGNVPEHFSGVDGEFLWGATLASETTTDELGRGAGSM